MNLMSKLTKRIGIFGDEEDIGWLKKNQHLPLREFLDLGIKKRKEKWLNYLIVHLLNKRNNIRYARFAARLVMDIFQNKHPNGFCPPKDYKHFFTAICSNVSASETFENTGHYVTADYAEPAIEFAFDFSEGDINRGNTESIKLKILQHGFELHQKQTKEAR